MDGVSVKINGIKEIEQLFRQLPKQIKKESIWTKFYRDISKPLVKAAKDGVKDSGKTKKYWRNKKIEIPSGTLKKSIKFFQTRKAKKQLGGYVGPKVYRGKKAALGGWYGAFVEYGSEVKHFGKAKGKDNPFMANAFKAKSGIVISGGMTSAERIFKRVLKSHEKRLRKYGSLGY
tara:strand:+ start:78 stop:602 length:525 start_codon:yes stop_codon:yes gene_type:complete